MRRARHALTVAAVLCVAAGCAKNPYTNRSQLMLVDQGEEMKLGAQAYREFLKDAPRSTDPRDTEPVRRVSERIIQAAKQSKYADTAARFDWKVTVVKDDKTMNAFCLPGGKIVVYTGIFPAAKDEAGLAAIVGHEVTHALARHGAERMSQQIVTQTGLGVAAVVLGMSGLPAPTTGLIMEGAGLTTQYGVLLPFSRSHESEADYVGLLLAAQAGYDPREAVHVWERMETLGGSGPPQFLSTHPSHGTRIEQLNEWMPEALAVYDPNAGVPNTELPAIGGR